MKGTLQSTRRKKALGPVVVVLGSVTLVLVATLLLRGGHSGALNAVTDSTKQNGLRLELVVGKGTYAPNEPITASATLTNIGLRAVSVSSDGLMWSSILDLDGS